MSTPQSLERASEFVRETIPRVQTPCPAYTGFVAAIQTYNGVPIIVMAATKTALVDVVREINPRISALDLSLCMKASIVSEKFIDRAASTEEDEEL